MTLRGMVRISALGAGLLAAIAVASSVAHSQTPPQVWVERPKQDTVVQLAPTNKPIVFGFSRTVMQVTGLPNASPMRAYCVRARIESDVILVDPPVSEAAPELPQCDQTEVPLVIRPLCQLTPEEHLAWRVKRERPVLFVCGPTNPPVVLLLTKPGSP